MAHIHSVYDTEPHFQIDKTSREIKNVSNSKTTITQFDHNSERFTFEIPRFIDGHDMSLCNKVQVHYINIDSTDKTNKISGVYTVDDLQLSPEDENIVICSWLISQNATQLAGSLVFLLRFACVTDDVLDYAWNTTKCTTISVSNGLFNGEAIIEEYFDILSVWEQNIIADVTAGIDKTIEEKVDNVKIVETATGSAITIESSQAPIPYLKLSGKTTQDETTLDLSSVGDSGSFNVGFYGKNLYNNTATNNTLNGVTFTVNADKSVTAVGTATITTTFNIGEFRNLIKGATYKTLGGLCCRLQLKDGTKKYVNNYQYFVYTDNIDRIFAYMSVGVGQTVNTTIYPMLVLDGVTDETYEQYKVQTLTMPYTLRSVGDIKDEVDFNRGVKIQRFDIVDLGTLTWGKDKDGVIATNSLIGKVQPVANNGALANMLCSAYQTDTADNTWNGVTDKTISMSNTGFLRVRDNNITDYTTLATQMSGKYLIYPLATPIETAISESELNDYRQLVTNKGTTTVLSECDVEMLYYVNKPNAQAIGDIHTQINKDYFKTLSLIAENVATVEETESESEE